MRASGAVPQGTRSSQGSAVSVQTELFILQTALCPNGRLPCSSDLLHWHDCSMKMHFMTMEPLFLVAIPDSEGMC